MFVEIYLSGRPRSAYLTFRNADQVSFTKSGIASSSIHLRLASMLSALASRIGVFAGVNMPSWTGRSRTL